MSGSARCPECGGEVKFSAPGSVLSVCTYCKSAVAKAGLDYKKLGKVAQLVEVSSPLCVGLRGKAYGGFQVIGRLQLDHGAGAWNEWYLALDNGRWLWLAETQGRYYLTAPIDSVPGTLRFQSLGLGHSVTLPDPAGGGLHTLHVTEIHTAKMVSAEGELPFAITPGEETRYADLAGSHGRFGTLDYGPPGSSELRAYLGQQVRIGDLKLDEGSFDRPPALAKKSGARMSCPQCDGALSLTAPDAAQRVTCPYCRALIDVTAEPLKALTTLKPLDEFQPLIPLGKSGELRGARYTVIGHLRRQITKGEGGHWDEYLLHTEQESDSAFHYLIESGGHFTLAIPISIGDVSGSGTVRSFLGNVLRLAERCTTKVSFVSGEFPWAVAVGEETKVEDYAAEGLLGSIETSVGKHQEINVSIGHYLDGASVLRAFGVATAPPRQLWVAPHQPNPFRARLGEQRQILYLASILLLILMSWSCSRNKGQGEAMRWDLKTVPGVAAAAEHIVLTEPFQISQAGRQVAVEWELSANVDNSWLGADVSMINEETGQAYTFGLEVSYYSGVDDGESWSEGSRSNSTVVPEIPAGKYVVRIEPAWPVSPPCASMLDCGGILDGYQCTAGRCVKSCSPPADAATKPQTAAERAVEASLAPFRSRMACGKDRVCVNGECALPAVTYTLRMTYPTTRSGYAFFLWLMMAIVPAWTWIRRNRFEARRQEDSSET